MPACVRGFVHEVNAMKSHSSLAVLYSVRTQVQDAACEPSQQQQ